MSPEESAALREQEWFKLLVKLLARKWREKQARLAAEAEAKAKEGTTMTIPEYRLAVAQVGLAQMVAEAAKQAAAKEARPCASE